jgi:hypothetical protein
LDGIAISEATHKNYTPVQSGNYTDVVTLQGCSSSPSNSIYVAIFKSALIKESDEGQSAAELVVYPNPNDGVFNYEIILKKQETLSIKISNYLGVQVYYMDNMVVKGTVTGQIDLQDQPNGIYILSLTGETTSLLKKIVIEN